MSKPLTLCALLLAATGAVAVEHETWPVEVIEVMDAERIVLFLKPGEIAAIPAWQPGRGEPPLNLPEVVAALGAYLAAEPGLAGGRIHEMEFKPVRTNQYRDRWYCLAQIRLADGTRKYVAVLPGGAVVPAIVEPRP